MRPTRKQRILVASTVLAAAAMLTSGAAHAAPGAWAVDADGNWGDPGNWAGGVIPDDSTSKASFVNNISATRTVTLEASHTTNAPEFSDNGAAGSGWVVAGPGQLNLSGTALFRTPTTISANISAASFTAGGGSRLTLTGTNSVSGTLGIASGVVNAVDGVGLPATAALAFSSTAVGGQAILEGNGTFTRKTGSGAGQVRWLSGVHSGGWAASGGVFNISLTNSNDVAGGPLVWGTGGFVSTGGPVGNSQVQLNSSTADNLVDLQNAISLGTSTRGITVFDNPASTADRARLSGVISGTGSLQKSGAGVLELTNSNSYSGAISTTVTAGTLLANNTTGSATGAGIVFVNAGATIGGTGSITSLVSLAGTLAPGDAGIESLGTGSVNFNAGSTFAAEIDTSGTPTADLLNITGNLGLLSGASLTLTDLGANFALPLNTTLTLIDYSAVWTGNAFTGYADDSTFTLGANQFKISYNGPTGTDTAVTLTAVPEPASLGVLAIVGVGISLQRKRKGVK